MKKLLLLLASFVVVFHAASLPIVYGQTKEDVITAEEKKASQELAGRFVKRLNEAGDVEPLIKEMYVTDFMSRYVKEERQNAKAVQASDRGIMFTPGLEYDSRLLEMANEDDWWALYVNTFNFLNYGITFMVNEGGKAKAAKGKELDDDERDEIIGKTYPAPALKLLNGNLILRNMMQMGNDHRPIKNVEELREVNKILAEVNRSFVGKEQSKLTTESQAVMKQTFENFPDAAAPNLSVCDRECFGFERGRRLITLFATPMHALIIAKVGTDYKIISAQISSID